MTIVTRTLGTLLAVGLLGLCLGGPSSAQAQEFVYQPINPTLRSLRESGAIPPFPDLTDPDGNLFGTAFSLDGIHPNSATHEVVANTTIEAINAEYGTSLSTLP